jgi:hypothetical protein
MSPAVVRSPSHVHKFFVRQQNRLWAIPERHTVNGVRVGQVFTDIRSGHSPIPGMYLLDMDAMGYEGG